MIRMANYAKQCSDIESDFNKPQNWETFGFSNFKFLRVFCQ